MLWAAGFFIIIGLICLAFYRKSSKLNHFLRRAPQLKIKELNAFDDTWVTGIVEAGVIVAPPHFLYESVYYDYQLYEKKIRLDKDSSGRVQRVETWELAYTKSDSVPFVINDTTGKIIVNPDQAVMKFVMTDCYETEWWKHTLSFIPASGLVSSVGVANDKKSQLIGKGETPLMLTVLGRKDFMQHLKSEENFLKYCGLVCIWLFFGFVFAEFLQKSTSLDDSPWLLSGLSGILGVIFFVGIYYYITYSSLVVLRSEVVNSWGNIDVELKVRRDLIPAIVGFFKNYLNHEADSLTKITRLRQLLQTERRLGNRIKMENDLSIYLSKIKVHIESTPELKDSAAAKFAEKIRVIEDKIAHATSHFNAVTEEYNDLVSSFPSRFIAKGHNFYDLPFFGDFSAKTNVVESAQRITLTAESKQKVELRKADPSRASSLPREVSEMVKAKEKLDCDEKAA